LLDKFNSPANVLNASIADLARIPGLGNMRAEKNSKDVGYSCSQRSRYLYSKKIDD
jgi:DNA excision repair protein ERCC-4